MAYLRRAARGDLPAADGATDGSDDQKEKNESPKKGKGGAAGLFGKMSAGVGKVGGKLGKIVGRKGRKGSGKDGPADPSPSPSGATGATGAGDPDGGDGQPGAHPATRIRPTAEQIVMLRRLTAWLIPESHITWHETLAKGAFGQVWRCDWVGHEVAIKKLFKVLDLHADPATALDFQRECETLQAIRHPHLLKFYGAGVTLEKSPEGHDQRMPFLMTEFMLLGSLRSVLNETPRLIPYELSCRMALEIAKGMRHLHSLEIVHRDLKSDNCLCDRNMNTKVCDFGSSKLLKSDRPLPGVAPTGKNAAVSDPTETATGWAGTMLWAAPETFDAKNHDNCNNSVDLYSYGVIMYELLTRRPPWDTLPDNYIEVWGFLDTQLPNGVRPPVDPALAQPHPEYIKIMNDAWLTDPAARPTFAEVEAACLTL